MYKRDYKKRLLFIAVVCIFISLVMSVYAHPGKTDANGGHYDRQTGEYHYHHGYPAHQHIDGKCPYTFDDKTNRDSGSVSSSEISRSEITKPSSTTTEYKFKLSDIPGMIFELYLIICIVYGLIERLR